MHVCALLSFTLAALVAWVTVPVLLSIASIITAAAATLPH